MTLVTMMNMTTMMTISTLMTIMFVRKLEVVHKQDGGYLTRCVRIFFSLIIFPVLSCCHEGWTFLATAQLAKQKHQQY